MEGPDDNDPLIKSLKSSKSKQAKKGLKVSPITLIC